MNQMHKKVYPVIEIKLYINNNLSNIQLFTLFYNGFQIVHTTP